MRIRDMCLLEPAFFPHLLGAEVGVTPGAIPVPRDGFGVERGDHAKVFTHSVQDETSHPQVISHLDALAWPHLEFPL